MATAAVYSAEGAGAGAARLLCYVESARDSEFTECTHLVYAGNLRGDKLTSVLKDYRKNNPRLKIILRVTELNKVCFVFISGYRDIGISRTLNSASHCLMFRSRLFKRTNRNAYTSELL